MGKKYWQSKFFVLHDTIWSANFSHKTIIIDIFIVQCNFWTTTVPWFPNKFAQLRQVAGLVVIGKLWYLWHYYVGDTIVFH